MENFYQHVYTIMYAHGYHKSRKAPHAVKACRLIIKKLKDTESVLDVGCARGWALRRLQKKGKIVAGIDVAKQAVKHVRKLGIECKLASVTKIPYSSNSFDVVMSTDVMEHLRTKDVKKALTECFRVAKKYLVFKIFTARATYRAKWMSPVSRFIDNPHLTIRKTEWWIKQCKHIHRCKVKYRSNQLFVCILK